MIDIHEAFVNAELWEAALYITMIIGVSHGIRWAWEEFKDIAGWK